MLRSIRTLHKGSNVIGTLVKRELMSKIFLIETSTSHKNTSGKPMISLPWFSNLSCYKVKVIRSKFKIKSAINLLNLFD